MLNQVQLTVILWYKEGGMAMAIDEMLQFGLLVHHVRMWCNLLMRVFYFYLGNDLFLSRPQLPPWDPFLMSVHNSVLLQRLWSPIPNCVICAIWYINIAIPLNLWCSSWPDTFWPLALGVLYHDNIVLPWRVYKSGQIDSDQPVFQPFCHYHFRTKCKENHEYIVHCWKCSSKYMCEYTYKLMTLHDYKCDEINP